MMLTPAPPSAAAVKVWVLTERAVVGVDVLVFILKHEARTMRTNKLGMYPARVCWWFGGSVYPT